jgi:hypothetical protein
MKSALHMAPFETLEISQLKRQQLSYVSILLSGLFIFHELNPAKRMIKKAAALVVLAITACTSWSLAASRSMTDKTS